MSSKYSTKQCISDKGISDKVGAKIFRHFWDIAIFVLGYFILPHPVYRLCHEHLQYRHYHIGSVWSIVIGTTTAVVTCFVGGAAPHCQEHEIHQHQGHTHTCPPKEPTTVSVYKVSKKTDALKWCLLCLTQIITRHSLVRAKGEVFVLLLLFCSFFCQWFLDNPQANSHQILHAGVLWFRMWLLPFWGLAAPGGRKKGQMKFSLLWESMGNFCILAVFERYLSNACTDPHQILFV